MTPELERYSKQILFHEIGEGGQRKLLAGRALLCGCGALGTVIGETLVRAGVGGSHGQVLPVFPNESACLRCLIERLPDPGTTETCDTAGVIGPAVNVIASLASVHALKILSGQPETISRKLAYFDVWEGTL